MTDTIPDHITTRLTGPELNTWLNHPTVVELQESAADLLKRMCAHAKAAA